MALAVVPALIAVAITTAVLAGSTSAGTSPVILEHFTCYPISAGFQPRTVSLADQFEQKATEVVKPVELCAPTIKNNEIPELRNPRDHLKCYQIRDAPGQPTFQPREVLINNQFGEARIRATKIRSLCVPTLKSQHPTRPPSATEPPPSIAHFKCYDATQVQPGFVKKPVGLRDQFGTSSNPPWWVVKLRRLCNPVSKNGGPVPQPSDPRNHLVCYQIEFRVATRNQFGTEVITSISGRQLCVPSTKQPVNPTR